MSLRKIKHPELFQDLHGSNYFEGWYFKFQDASGEILAVIPGISRTKDKEFAFIQVLSSHLSIATYTKYDIEDFHYDEDPWSIRIADNYFGLDRIELHILADDIELIGKFNLANIIPLRTSFYAPSIMGPFAYLNSMECYHAVLSMHHEISGQARLNGQLLDFDDSCGYLEKDWGRSFPKEYIWIHGQDVLSHDTLFFSLARIPLAGRSFDGLIAVFYVDGVQHRFATYNLAHVKTFTKNGDSYLLEVKQGEHTLRLRLQMRDAHPLLSPQLGEMSGTIKESLTSTCEVQLLRNSQILAQRTFKPALAEVEWKSFDCVERSLTVLE
ncbi:MAG: tocopherol cyclase family protein [Coriobacteriia bacterium]|nr:tocopherol cyclase family protein [Coriobacteriia bacterium]MCL2870016.1 tocopherol cyclase family protein [Coriobacteriia bacterium]